MALSERYDCHGYYKKYNMDGEIKIGTGIVKVHDLFNPLPDFMKDCDAIFSDPPCNKSNINSFYTKADKADEQKESFAPFEKRFFECIDEIAPKKLFLETFKDNHKSFFEECKKRYAYVKEYNIFYYKTKPCYLIVASNEPFEYADVFEGKDELVCLEYICKNVDFNCIGDLCMGTGLCGWYANKYNRKFAGTELNKKRLAMLIERINVGRFGV